MTKDKVRSDMQATFFTWAAAQEAADYLNIINRDRHGAWFVKRSRMGSIVVIWMDCK